MRSNVRFIVCLPVRLVGMRSVKDLIVCLPVCLVGHLYIPVEQRGKVRLQVEGDETLVCLLRVVIIPVMTKSLHFE